VVDVVVERRPGSDRLIRRSLGMLGSVRSLVAALVVVGLIASALPYVTAAAFGPMMQVVADAGMSGNLSGVWGLRGPLVAREDGLLTGVSPEFISELQNNGTFVEYNQQTIVSAGQASRSATMRSALASSRCSQLSSTISSLRSPMNRITVSILVRPG